MSLLVFEACVAVGVLSWCLGSFLFVRARRDYRGPSGRALLLSPFALWDPANYTGSGAFRIRRSLICLLVFIACAGLGVAAVRFSANARLW
jgi:hypothetical protein